MEIKTVVSKNTEYKELKPTAAAKVVSSLASVTMSTLSNSAFGGLRGAALGFAVSCLDEGLIAKKVVSKHYLSNVVFVRQSMITPLTRLVCALWPSCGFAFEITTQLTIGLALPYFSDDLFAYKDKLETPINCFLTVNRFFDPDQKLSTRSIKTLSQKAYKSPFLLPKITKEYVLELLENPFLVNMLKATGYNIANIAVSQLFLRFLAGYDANSFLLKMLAQKEGLFKGNSISLDKIRPIVVSGLQILTGLIIKNKLAWHFKAKRQEIFKEQKKNVIEHCTRLMMVAGNGAKIITAEDGKEIIQHINDDFANLVSSGSNQLVNKISQSVETVFSLYNIAAVFQSLLAPFMVTIPILQAHTRAYASKIQKEVALLSVNSTKLAEIKADLLQSLDVIELRGGSEFIEHQYNEKLKEQNVIQAQLDRIKNNKENNDKTFDFINKFLGYGYFGLHLLLSACIQKNWLTLPNYQTIDPSIYPASEKSVDIFYRFATSGANIDIENKELKSSQHRVRRLFEIVSSMDENQLQRSKHGKKEIVIRGYKLFLKDKVILNIDSLKFKSNQRYVITGKSGCGKSSLLRDIKQGLLGGLSSKGKIIVPEESKHPMMFIDQDLYLPKDSTLFETICFPLIAEELSQTDQGKIKERAKMLFRELEIDSQSNNSSSNIGLSSLLDSKEFKLSGGQKKKVAAIQAILTQPSILILDETFTGLDKHSLKLVQKALLKYLPETTMITIDHHADDNNELGFYQKKIHFENSNFSLIDYCTVDAG